MNPNQQVRAFRVSSSILLPVLCLATLLGCSGGDGLPTSALPTPSIIPDGAVSFCGVNGGPSLSLDRFSADVTLNHPQSFPAGADVDRVAVSGTVSALGADEVIYIVAMDLDAECLVIGFQEAMADGSGGFSGEVYLESGHVDIRIAAVVYTGDPEPIFGCGFGETCVSSDVGNFVGSSDGSLAIRLSL